MATPEYTSSDQPEPPPTRLLKLASRPSLGRLVLSLLLFLVGVVVGAVGLSAWTLLSNPDQSALPVPPSSANAAVVLHASSTYVNQVAQQQTGSFGVPGTIKNLHVSFVHDGPVLITGDDALNILGLTLTRRFSLEVQVYVASCKPIIHVLHANFSGVPITGFATSFEQNVNQQLQGNISGLPSGFVYCMIAIHTEPQEASATFSAQPMA